MKKISRWERLAGLTFCLGWLAFNGWLLIRPGEWTRTKAGVQFALSLVFIVWMVSIWWRERRR